MIGSSYKVIYIALTAYFKSYSDSTNSNFYSYIFATQCCKT